MRKCIDLSNIQLLMETIDNSSNNFPRCPAEKIAHTHSPKTNDSNVHNVTKKFVFLSTSSHGGVAMVLGINHLPCKPGITGLIPGFSRLYDENCLHMNLVVGIKPLDCELLMTEFLRIFFKHFIENQPMLFLQIDL